MNTTYAEMDFSFICFSKKGNWLGLAILHPVRWPQDRARTCSISLVDPYLRYFVIFKHRFSSRYYIFRRSYIKNKNEKKILINTNLQYLIVLVLFLQCKEGKTLCSSIDPVGFNFSLFLFQKIMVH